MAKKTNKTSHVLNLLTNGAPTEAEEETADSGAPEQQPQANAGSRGETPVSGAAAPGTAAAGASQAGSSSSETSVQAASVQGASGAAAPAQESASGAVSKEPGPKPSSSGDKTVIVVNETSENDKISSAILNRLTNQLEKEEEKAEEISYRMVNVMEQILSRQNLNRYMQQYGVCSCSRCRADVLALILTRLPAKYVVVDNSSVAPIIGYYEGKFKIRILTEIIKSCMDVKDSPRHGREDTL